MPYYLTPKQDDFNQIPELQVCIAEALYDAEAVLKLLNIRVRLEGRALRDLVLSSCHQHVRRRPKPHKINRGKACR